MTKPLAAFLLVLLAGTTCLAPTAAALKIPCTEDVQDPEVTLGCAVDTTFRPVSWVEGKRDSLKNG